MRRFPRLRPALLAVLVVAWTGCAGGTPDGPPRERLRAGVNAPRHIDAPYVILLSRDGFWSEYLDRYPTPTFQRLAREGARARAMIPVFPTKTFPTHYSMATGLYAENHRLVGNRFWDPERRAYYRIDDRSTVEDGSWYGGEPIWVTAERQGMVSGAYYFVGTEADVGGIRPTFWHRYDATLTKAQRVDSVLAWLDLPPARRPHLVTMYFSDLDDAGHAHGPESPGAEAAVRAVDEAVGRLLRGIESLLHGDRVYLFLVSDHGMLRAEASRAQPLDLTLFPGVRMVEYGPYATLWVDEGGSARLPALRDSIQAVLPEATVWIRTDVPERFRYRDDPRIGDLLILAEPGATVVPPDRVPARDAFTHGWDNRTPGMAALFLAWGPEIAGGQLLEPFEAIHLYPLLAHLLRLDPAPADGRLEVLAPILGLGEGG